MLYMKRTIFLEFQFTFRFFSISLSPSSIFSSFAYVVDGWMDGRWMDGWIGWIVQAVSTANGKSHKKGNQKK